MEIFSSGRVLQLDNFRSLKGWGWSDFRSMRLWRQDKGQKACAKAFMDAVRKKVPTPISQQELFEVSKISIEIANMLRQ